MIGTVSELICCGCTHTSQGLKQDSNASLGGAHGPDREPMELPSWQTDHAARCQLGLFGSLAGVMIAEVRNSNTAQSIARV